MAHDGAAIAVEKLEGGLPTIEGDDPLEIRWYLQTVEKGRILPGFEFGFAELRYAEWGPAQVFSVPEELHSVDDNPNLPKERMVQHTALEAQRKLEEQFAGKDHMGNLSPNKANKGLQIGFVGEKDAAKMKVISDTLLPSLPRIREIAKNLAMPSPIDAVCLGQDDLDFGERQTCPTCWLQWASSGLCGEYIQSVAASGRLVEDADGKQWTVTPTFEELEAGRRATLTALQTGIQHQQTQWRIIVGELEKGTRNDLDEGGYQHTIRKDIHQTKPQDRQLKLLKEVASASGGGNDELVRQLAQSQIETNALLRHIAQNIPTVNNLVDADNDGTPDYRQADFTIGIGDAVSCDGKPGRVASVKTGGWFVVNLDNGETTTVRKDKLEAI